MLPANIEPLRLHVYSGEDFQVWPISICLYYSNRENKSAYLPCESNEDVLEGQHQRTAGYAINQKYFNFRN